MQTRMGPAVALGSFICCAGPASAALALPCSSDTFPVDGTTLTIRVCDVSSARVPQSPVKLRAVAAVAELQETVSVDARAPLVRSVRYERPANEETAHALDDVPLQSLGIERILHVLLTVRNGSARLEHALLVPGAISLK